MEPYLRQRIENWAADFASGDAVRGFPAPCAEYATEVLTTFLVSAAEGRDGLEGVGDPEVRHALVGHVAALSLPASVRAKVPDLCAAFLEDLEAQGRLGGGRAMANLVRAARPAFDAASGAPAQPHRRVASKLSPNDPCPCGSGRKYKKCCQGGLA